MRPHPVSMPVGAGVPSPAEPCFLRRLHLEALEPSMAESTSVALAAAPIPSTAEIKRAQKLVREDFVHQGEDPAGALAPGTPRRRALDGALAELEQGAKHPSTKWRRRYSLMLGLERLLSQEEPKLADGTVLSAH